LRLLALLPPQVVLVVAWEDLHFAGGHFDDARGQLVDEIAVVRHEDNRAVVILQRRQQHVLGAHIEVIGGLVEQQEIGRHHQHARQRVAVAFASGEHADALEHFLA